MATRSGSLAHQPAHAEIYKWEGITESDTGGSVRIEPEYASKTFIAQGTFNGGALTLQVSVDGSTFVNAVDVAGDAVTLSAATTSVAVASNGLHWRIANDGNGTSEDVDCYLVAVRR